MDVLTCLLAILCFVALELWGKKYLDRAYDQATGIDWDDWE